MTKIYPKLLLSLQIIFLALVVIIVLASANPLFQTPNRDSGIFMYIGNQILKGKLLYVDVWDNKGPLIFYINALELWIGRGSLWGVWGIQFVFLFFAAFLGFKLMEKLWGMVAAIFGTLMWFLAFSFVIRGGDFTEEYSLLFGLIALYAFWLHIQQHQHRRYPIIIGITLALSFLFRANNIGIQLAIIIVIAFSGVLDRKYKQSLGYLLWIGLGTLSILLLVSLYFLAMGTLGKMVQAAVIYNFFYSQGGSSLTKLAGSFVRGINLFGYPTLLPALLGFIVMLVKLPEAIRSKENPFKYIELLFLIGLPLEILLSGLSGNNFPHYYICWTPYIGFFSGHILNTDERSNKNSLQIVLGTILLISSFNLGTLVQYRTAFTKILFDRKGGIELVDPVAKYVREHTSPSDTVLVWGFQPYINVLAHRDSPTGMMSYPQFANSPITNELNSRFYEDLVKNKPALVVDMVNPNNDTIPFIDPAQRESQYPRLKSFDAPSNLDQVFNFIHSNYSVVTTINGTTIYQLNQTIP